MAGASFQTAVNIQYAAGLPGALYDDSPERSASWELNSSSAAYNIVGATAFTATSADPGSGDACGVAAAGGTGAFVGILSNSKLYANAGTSSGALYPTMTLPNDVIGQLTTMGHLWVSLPGPANVGDQVCYDQTTGALSTFPKTTAFTASILSTGVMTVTAVTAGMIQPGMILNGVGVNGVAVIGYDSGTGNTGSYFTNYVGSNISAEAMTGNSLPPPAASVTGVVTTSGVFSATAIGSGYLGVGQVLSGTGLLPNTTIIALGTGTGGDGTYTVSPAPATLTTSGTITADAQTQIPRAEVILFQPAGNGGLGVISLTSA